MHMYLSDSSPTGGALCRSPATTEELEEEDITDDVEDGEGEELELSETITVGGVEYYVLDQDDQKIVLTMEGEPIGVYDEETDTIQEAEFE